MKFAQSIYLVSMAVCRQLYYAFTCILYYTMLFIIIICSYSRGISFAGLKVFEKRVDNSFLNGFSYWNDGGRRMVNHKRSTSHEESVKAYYSQHSKTKINEALDASVAKSKVDNHDMLSYVIEAVRLLSRQGLALRGSHKLTAEHTSEPDANMWQTLKSFSRISEHVRELLKRSTTYSSPDVQNELLALMANTITREIAETIRNCQWYTVMVDETPDVSRKEQAVICFR